MNDQVRIRNMVQSDEQFVYASWLSHYKYSSPFAKRIKHDIYFSNHHAIIERILTRHSIKKIAHPSDDPEVIVGFLVMEGEAENPLLHFLLVKRAFRKMGVATALLNGINIKRSVFTHWTDDCDWFVRKYPSAVYNPYRI